jgi:hypothetical protein
VRELTYFVSGNGTDEIPTHAAERADLAMSDVKIPVRSGKCGPTVPIVLSRRSSNSRFELRRASQPDNRQVGMPGDMFNFQVETGAWPAPDQRVRQRTRGATWPESPWFQPGTTIRGKPLEVDLVRRLAPEGAVGSVLVVPVEDDDQFCAHGLTPHGNHDPLQRFLDRAHGAFQNGDTAMFAQGTETGPGGDLPYKIYSAKS